MKKIFFILTTVLLINSTINAQTEAEEIDLVQAAIGISKKEAFTSFIILDETNKNSFWNLYEEYETKRKELGKERIMLLEKYVAEYEKMDEEKTSEALDNMIRLANSFNKLTATYAKKMKKNVGPKAAAQFFQLETYINSVVRATIIQNIPLIGEFEN